MKSPALRVEPSAACALIRSESEGDLGGGETLSEEAHVPNSSASFSEACEASTEVSSFPLPSPSSLDLPGRCGASTSFR